VTAEPRLRELVRGAPLLSARILALSFVVRVAKHVVPLPRLVRLAWSRRHGRLHPEDKARIVRLTRGVPGLRPIPGRDNCLERSVLAYRYLSRAGADPILVSGVSRRPGGIAGHVWVLLDGQPVHESPDAVAEFVPVVRFGAGGHRL
jgi:Transglutaminase-like superfamily